MYHSLLSRIAYLQAHTDMKKSESSYRYLEEIKLISDWWHRQKIITQIQKKKEQMIFLGKKKTGKHHILLYYNYLFGDSVPLAAHTFHGRCWLSYQNEGMTYTACRQDVTDTHRFETHEIQSLCNFTMEQ